VRPPNVAPPRGSDAGAGVPCDQLIEYGKVQPPGPPPTVYGAGAAAAAAPASAPPAVGEPAAPGTPAPAPAAGGRGGRGAGGAGRGGGGGGGGGLGAAGMATRNTQIPTAPALPYAFVEPPHAPAGTLFSNVAGVALLKNGHLIVAQRLPMYDFLEYDAQNRLIRAFAPNITARAHGMRVDKDDNIWVTDQSCHMVIKMNVQGEVLMTLGTTGKAGTWDEAKGDHLFNQPTDVAFAPNGDIYVSTAHGGPDPRVVRFDKNGKFITTWSMAHADGSPANIHTLVVDKKGQVWVSDREVKMLYVFDANGKRLREIQMKNLVCGLFIDSKDELWMTTGMDGQLLHLDWDGNVLQWIGKEGFGANDFGEAHYMAMTPDRKTIWISDTVNNDIKKLQAN
jgi:hypothetical protein